MDVLVANARIALEEVCARGDLRRAQELYADDLVARHATGRLPGAAS